MSTAATTADLAHIRTRTAGPRRTLWVSASGTLLVLAVFSAVVTTVGASTSALGGGVSDETWTLSGMSLGLAVALLTVGTLADDLGRRQAPGDQQRPARRHERAGRIGAERRRPDRGADPPGHQRRRRRRREPRRDRPRVSERARSGRSPPASGGRRSAPESRSDRSPAARSQTCWGGAAVTGCRRSPRPCSCPPR